MAIIRLFMLYRVQISSLSGTMPNLKGVDGNMEREEALLMSYIIADVSSKSDIVVLHDTWIEIVESMRDEFKNAGALRQTVCQIWNKEGVFRLGFMWEYRNDKAFIDCQKLFREAEMELGRRTEIAMKVISNRGVILTDMMF